MFQGKKTAFHALRPQENLKSGVRGGLLVFAFMLIALGPFGPVKAQQAQTPTLLLPPSLTGLSPLDLAPTAPQQFDDKDNPLQPPPTGGDLSFSSETPMRLEPLDDPTGHHRGGAGSAFSTLDSVGTLTERDGGFAYGMWGETSLERALYLVKRLPVDPSLQAAQGILVRFLLTGAAAPKGGQNAIEGLAQDGLLLQWRVKKLFDMGRYQYLNDLFARLPLSYQGIGRAPSVPSEQDGARTWSFDVARAEAILFARDYDDFCQAFLPHRLEQRGQAPSLDLERLSRYQIFCHLHRGDIDKAMLGLDLLRETGADDPLFVRLALKMAGVESAIGDESASDLEALYLVMAEKTKSPLPPSLLPRLKGDLQIRYASFDFLPLVERIKVAEQAVLNGGEGLDLLLSLYQGVFPSEKDRDRLLKGEGLAQENWPYRYAYLWNLVKRAGLPAVQAELMTAAFDAAKSQEEKRLLSLLLAPQLAAITPTDDLLWFASTAGRALYVAGRPNAAGKWLLLARKSLLSSDEASMMATGLWPYARLSGEGLVNRYGNLKGWSMAHSSRQGGLGEENTILLQSLFEGLKIEEDVPLEILDSDESVGQALVPAASLFFALEEEREKYQSAETIALSLLLMGDAQPTEIHGLTYATLLDALLSVGLEKEARQLAIEAAFLNGL